MECSGFKLKWSSAEEDEGLYVGQQAYIKELLSRHSEVAHATSLRPSQVCQMKFPSLSLPLSRSGRGLDGPPSDEVSFPGDRLCQTNARLPEGYVGPPQTPEYGWFQMGLGDKPGCR